MKQHLCLLALAICLLASCHNNSIKEDDASFDLSKVKKVDISEVYTTGSLNLFSDSMSIIRIDTTEAIGTINKLISDEDGYYVLDKTSDNVLRINAGGDILWDLNGKTSKVRSRKNKVRDFSLRGNRLFVMDEKFNLIILDKATGRPMGGRMALYNTRYKTLAGNFFVDTAGNFVISDNSKTKSASSPYKIAILDPTAKQVKGLHYSPPYDKLAWMNEKYPIHPFSDNSGFFYSDALNDTIYSYKDGVFRRAYVVDFGKKKTPLSMINSGSTLADFSSSKYAGNISQVIDLTDIVSFKFYTEQKYPVTFIDKKTNLSRTFFPLLFDAQPLVIIPNILCGYKNNIYFSIDPQQVLDAYANLKKALYQALDKATYDAILQKKYPLFYKMYNGVAYNSNPMIISVLISRNNIFKRG
jgi:hypothetical protein